MKINKKTNSTIKHAVYLVINLVSVKKNLRTNNTDPVPMRQDFKKIAHGTCNISIAKIKMIMLSIRITNHHANVAKVTNSNQQRGKMKKISYHTGQLLPKFRIAIS